MENLCVEIGISLDLPLVHFLLELFHRLWIAFVQLQTSIRQNIPFVLGVCSKGLSSFTRVPPDCVVAVLVLWRNRTWVESGWVRSLGRGRKTARRSGRSRTNDSFQKASLRGRGSGKEAQVQWTGCEVRLGKLMVRSGSRGGLCGGLGVVVRMRWEAVLRRSMFSLNTDASQAYPSKEVETAPSCAKADSLLVNVCCALIVIHPSFTTTLSKLVHRAHIDFGVLLEMLG